MSIIYQTRNEKYRLFYSHNNSFVSHLHRQAEIIVVLSGSLTLTVEQTDIPLTEGHFFIVFPNQIHRLHTPEASEIALVIFDPDFCPALSQTLLHFQPFGTPLNLENLSCHGKLAWQALRELSAPAPETDLLRYIQGYLHLLLTDILSQMSLFPRTEQDSLELSQQILLYIEKHYTEDITLDVLAQKFHASRFTVSRIFSGRFCTSLPAFLTQRRLEHAMHLLQASPDMSVTEVAFESGFSSTRTFFRAFKETCHLSPRQYRLLFRCETNKILQ